MKFDFDEKIVGVYFYVIVILASSRIQEENTLFRSMV